MKARVRAPGVLSEKAYFFFEKGCTFGSDRSVTSEKHCKTGVVWTFPISK